jgi:hypothetical protein
MKKLAILALFNAIVSFAFGQEIEKDLKPFSRIIASPRINVILNKGERESIKIVYNDVDGSKINFEVRGKTLRIYLDEARHIEKPIRRGTHYRSRSMYEGVSVTAYVFYTDLDKLEIRGNQELTCSDAIDASRFVLRAYGENDITLASLNTEFFKASLYGENRLKVSSGRAVEQKYRLFGENKIDTRKLKSEFTITNIYGEGNVRINSSDEVVVNAFGEPRIQVDGGAYVNRRLILGKASIFSAN